MDPTAENDAFAARCLLRAARAGTLATTDEGQPQASLVTPAVAPDGAILLLLSSLAAHTRHLAADPRCALLVAGKPENENPQTAPRVTVTGVAVRSDDADLRRFWVRHHPYAALYADFSDFALWRLVPQAGAWVGGFARASLLAAADLVPPEDVVAAIAAAGPALLEAVNTQPLTGQNGTWRLLAADADGFDLVQDETLLRVAFPAPATSAGSAEEMLRAWLARSDTAVAL